MTDGMFTVRMVRELKGAPLAVLMLIGLAKMPVSNEWLCQMSGYTDKPVSLAVKLLSSPEYQLIVRVGDGWAINQNSEQLPLPLELPEQSNSDTDCLSRNISDSHDDDESLINLINTDSSSSIMNERETRKNSDLTTERILQETHRLFGSNVAANPTVLSRPPVWALAWISKAFCDMATRENPKGLQNPAGFVYRRLLERSSTPPPHLMSDPTNGLPNEYLAAIGAAEVVTETPEAPICWRCGRVPCECEED